jgi:peptidoglycan hydrolase CwlO-like protein
MQRELLSKIVAEFDPESVSSEQCGSAMQSTDDTSEKVQQVAAAYCSEGYPAAIDVPAAGLQHQASGNVAELLSNFHAATEGQVRAHMDMNERISRLENDETAMELRQTMRDLHGGLSALASETIRSIARVEDRIASVTESLSALGDSVSSSSEAFKHLSLSAHEKIADLREVLNSTNSRVEQVEKSAAEFKAGETQIFESINSLAEEIDLLRDKLVEEQKASGRLGLDLRVAERQIAGFSACEARVESLTERVSELDAHTYSSMGRLSEKLEAFSGELSETQKETTQLVARVRLAEGVLAGFSECEARIGVLEKQEAELRQIETSLRGLQGQGVRMSADVCTLREGIRSLQDEVGSANAESGQLKERMEKAESGLISSLEQGRSLAKLHALLAETYSAS